MKRSSVRCALKFCAAGMKAVLEARRGSDRTTYKCLDSNTCVRISDTGRSELSGGGGGGCDGGGVGRRRLAAASSGA